MAQESFAANKDFGGFHFNQAKPLELTLQTFEAMRKFIYDSCGIYFGTTGGQVYASSDAGDSWNPIVRDLPAVLSVEVQTLP